jgi:hypothetical protein
LNEHSPRFRRQVVDCKTSPLRVDAENIDGPSPALEATNRFEHAGVLGREDSTSAGRERLGQAMNG